jgi:hypothetical protein
MQKAPMRAARKLWDALRFSWVTLFKMGYRDTTVSGHLSKKVWLVIVWGEWVVGLYLVALLIYTLTNTRPLLNSLIKGVF